MLQQTQVKTVIPYFNKFTNKYKTLESLSKINENQILKLWEGLGYYRRAKNLLATVKLLVKVYNSKLPNNLKEIKKLPGVGDYTAGAVLSIAFKKPFIALDGNVKRVFSRIFNKHEKKIDFEKIIEKNRKNLFFSKRNSDFVEAMMEFGAIICKPKEPSCSICTINKICKFSNSRKNTKLTDKIKTNKKSYDIFCYLNKNKQIGLTKKNDIGFLKECSLPIVKKQSRKNKFKNWNFLCNYKNSISNKRLNINLYYKFSNKIPKDLNWFSIYDNKEFTPTFAKKIFKQVENLY